MWRTVIAGWLCASAACAPSAPPLAPTPDTAAIEHEAARELDDFHAAAAAADEPRYFAHFASRGVFLGTDGSERWDVAAFRAYAHPYFARGKGWRYEPGRRAISVSSQGDVVWFDEDLTNAHLGRARGTGVLVRENGRLLVAEYNLTVPIPNERMDAVLKLIDPAAPAPPTLEAIYKKAYEAATSFASVDPFADAARALLDALPEAKRHPDADTEFWLHNELTWLRWRQDDLAAALAEVDAAAVSIDHATFPDTKKVSLRLHVLWDRAYLLLEVAVHASPRERSAALDAALGAKKAYDVLAAAQHDSDGAAVLDAFFLLNQGKPKDAATAARRVDIDKDDDLQDLYVILRALEASGDRAGAEMVFSRICDGHLYLMKPLIVSQLAREGHRCPRR
jgi:hypothetical protein